MNHKDYLTNKNFCPIPWTGLMYNFDGTIKNCIRSSAPIGNIKENSITDIVNNFENTSTRRDMIENKSGQRCYPCYNLEKEKKSFDIISDRVFYIKELKTISLDTYKKIDSFSLHKVDIRWSNLCNFACVYCMPEFSSKWANELKVKIEAPDNTRLQEFKDYIFNHAAQLKHVYLAGGEPLLMKENLEFLELLKEKNSNVNLRINTNLSKVDTRIFDLICTFKNVHWIISVESMEQEYEYIRYGGKWIDFLDNLNIVRKLNHKVSFNMLHFVLNHRSIFNCVDYLKSLGFHNNSFIIGALLQPDYLNIRHLPDNMLNFVKEELTKRINEHPGFLLENGYRNMLEYITQPFEKDLANSLHQLKLLDQRRGIDSSKIFKELYNYGNQTF
jgi:sulfatase maturation enzyme AslB (radical SAM superfamily)